MKKVILPIILLIVVGAAIFYFTYGVNHEVDNQKKTTALTGSSEPIVISDSTNDLNNVADVSNDTITSGQEYIDEILIIRKPINDKFKDYLDKIKYKTIFTDSEAQNASAELESMIDEGIDKFNNLAIDKKFNDINNQMIKSLELLKKAKDALISYTNATNAEEQQKYSDLYEYNLNQSDDIVKDVAIPQ